VPSPFPGMDPYIEQPRLWPDFHNDLAAEIRAYLNQFIQPRYVARMRPHVAYEVIEVTETREHDIQPDASICQPQPPGRELGPGTPALTITPAPITSLIPQEVPLRLMSVEIRLSGTDQLVLAIEILSPANKRVGHQTHRKYQRKRRDLLRSTAHFLEIDLLRAGQRPPLARPVPPSAYRIMLSRTARRPTVEVWPIQLSDSLPVLPIPLLTPDPDVALDLGAVVASVYDRGGTGTLIDYTEPPPPPALSETEQA
jgi:hypothetical protein